MNNQASCKGLFAQAEAIIATGQRFESARTTEESLLHYKVALAMLEVICANGGSELYRVRVALTHVHGRLGRIYLARLDTSEAAQHLEAELAGHENILGFGCIRSFEASVLLAEAHVRGGRAQDAQTAAKSATEMFEQVEDYCSPSAVYAYYWLYRSEMMLGNAEAAAVAASEMSALLAADPDVINNGTASLLLREVATKGASSE